MARKRGNLSNLTSNDVGMDADAIRNSVASHVEYTQGKDRYSVTVLDFFNALAHATRDRMLDRWTKTQQRFHERDCKRVYYLSIEYLIGRLLDNSMLNLEIRDAAREALATFGVELERVEEEEWDAGLGNGGLGRLAACFLDSMATLGLPAMGYGIRYEYGIFKQLLADGAQVEYPDNWLRYGNPWEIPRPERLFLVKFFGRVESASDGNGRENFRWVDTEDIMAMAYDIPTPGFRNGVVNTLRLWSAKASRDFDFERFNRGDYISALEEKNASENISRVLYPNDSFDLGRELRLKQEYFFVSATLQDALRRHLQQHPNLENLPDRAVFQLNDTHPAVAVAELMRLLLDTHGFEWEPAWEITRRCFAYTNHTVMGEALERWPVGLFGHVLPRHLQIVYEINRRFLDEVRGRFPGEEARVERLSIIEEGPEKYVRMANLAIVGGSHVNGVSELHTQILKDKLFADFAALGLRRFSAKTNGITPRRWLLSCNPGLAALLNEHIGDGWLRDLEQLRKLEPLADDPGLQAAWRGVKLANKRALADFVLAGCGVGHPCPAAMEPASMFDVQIKRIHEYKRQILNLLHVVALYQGLRDGAPEAGATPVTFLFAGKAAPGYRMAKLIIHLINSVGAVVNAHPVAGRQLQVVFLPNYSVSLAERIVPAADVSEQISTAGLEASGTGNMKLSLNGALTIGTMDGANVEIGEAVGWENIFIFGNTYEQLAELRAKGYDPESVYRDDPVLRAVLDAIAAGEFSPDDPARFRPVVDLLIHSDPYAVLADFAAYVACRQQVFALFGDQAAWSRRSILNVARMGRFSSDNTIARYAEEIWGVAPEGGRGA